jgi:hypothetical protein
MQWMAAFMAAIGLIEQLQSFDLGALFLPVDAHGLNPLQPHLSWRFIAPNAAWLLASA